MGYYVNPIEGTKEEWLAKNGVRLHISITEADADNVFKNTKSTNKLIVCLVDNAFFSAAGIASNVWELKDFVREEDKRTKKFYVVPIDKLLQVNPNLKDVLFR